MARLVIPAHLHDDKGPTLGVKRGEQEDVIQEAASAIGDLQLHSSAPAPAPVSAAE